MSLTELHSPYKPMVCVGINSSGSVVVGVNRLKYQYYSGRYDLTTVL